MQLGDFHPRLAAQPSIKVRERFVEEEDLGPPGNGATDGDTLALAARERAGIAVQECFKPQDAGGFLDPGGDFGRRQLGHAQADAQVVAHRHMGVTRFPS